MPNVLATVLALLAFTASGWTSYQVFLEEDAPTATPIAIVDSLALADVVNESATQKEKDLKLQLITQQMNSLEQAGYLVLDMKGAVLRAPESIIVTAEAIGMK